MSEGNGGADQVSPQQRIQSKAKSFWPSKQEFMERKMTIVVVLLTLVGSVSYCYWFQWNEEQSTIRRQATYRYMMEEQEVTDQIVQAAGP